MDANTIINIAVYVAMAGVLFSFFMVTWTTFNSLYGNRTKVFNKINEAYVNSGMMDYKRLQLSRLGIMYRLKNYDLTPAYYVILRVGIGLLGAFLGYLVTTKLIAILIGFVIGYFAVPFYFKYEDKKDNDEMLMDIYNTYSNIKIQLSAGIYIRECLEYTYDMVTNKRYKEALAELILNFSDKTVKSTDAVMIFKNRFHSQEIDKLSALLGSFMQYGLNANHTDDIMTEIQGIIQAETLKTEHDIEMRAEATNFAFFAVIIAMVVYTVFSSFSLGGVI